MGWYDDHFKKDWTNIAQKVDPLGTKLIEGIVKNDSKWAGELGHAIGWDWLEKEADKNYADPVRGTGRGVAAAGAVFGAMAGAGALGAGAGGAAGGTAGAAGAGGATGAGIGAAEVGGAVGGGMTAGAAGGWSTGLGSTGMGTGAGMGVGEAAGAAGGSGFVPAGAAGGWSTGLGNTGLGASGMGGAFDWQDMIRQGMQGQGGGGQQQSGPADPSETLLGKQLEERQREEELARLLMEYSRG